MSDQDFFQDLFEDVPGFRTRKMFGGLGLFTDDLMFALVADDGLYLKVDEETEALFEAAGCDPFLYSRGAKSIKVSYRTVPEDFFDDPDQRSQWTRLAIEAAFRAKKFKSGF